MARPEAVGVRPDIAMLARAPRQLAGLEAAIGEMQRRSRADPDDPGGWRAHALGHAAVCAVASDDDAQVHGSWWFLPWHRAFLVVTELKLRAISGDPRLMLPYWNWSSDRHIPAPFARPGSPLAQALRHTPGRALRPAEVDWLPHDSEFARLGVAGLGALSFAASAPEEIRASFGGIATPNLGRWHGRSRLEGVPHNAIHNYVGGEGENGAVGDMTELATAALDPIFFAHHANLDRLWEIWRRDPERRASEPGGAFADRVFLFPWLDGTPIAIAMADLLDTRRSGYVYDRLEVFRDEPPQTAAGSAGPQLAAVTLRRPAGAGAGRAMLRITGVQPAPRPMTVEVVLSSPGGAEPGIVVGAYAAGRTFGPAVYPDTELLFDVTQALRSLDGTQVVVSVMSVALAPTAPPPFSWDRMEIVSL